MRAKQYLMQLASIDHDIAAKRRQLDRLCKEYRELDSKIQQINWLTDLR